MTEIINKIVLDLETQKDFAEAGGRNKHHLLRVSVAGIYSYPDDQYLIFEESEVPKLAEYLEAADLIIGFNNLQFDHEVLQPYLNFSLKKVPVLDLLAEIEKVLGHRISLESVAQATLGVGKTGSGLNAIRLWKSGQIDKLKQYCLDDVKLTREVYEYAANNGKLMYQDFFDTREIPLIFPEAFKRTNVVRQSSLF
jgi:DEAD/DEAH box helicase domain-containing protein